MKKIAILLFLILFFLNYSHGQVTWQWVHAGGSSGPLLSGTADQDIEDITTDKWGNVYVISNIYTMDDYIADQHFPGFGNPDAGETCIACFRCDGTLKWYKMVIGSEATAIAIKTDTLGGVYITGAEYISAAAGGGGPDSGYIMNATRRDTVLAPANGSIRTRTLYRSIYLLKLDTGGNFTWFRWPEPDTTTILNTEQSGIYDMDVDPSGNIYLLTMLKPGLYGNIFVAPDSIPYGPYILKYDRTGNCTGGFTLPIRGKNYDFTLHMKRDYKRDRFYLDGYSGGTAGDTAWLGGEMISGMYLACFNDTGSMLWMAHDSMTGPIGTVEDRVALDRFGNIYMTGACQWGLYFNGTEFTGGGAFAVKLDTNGHNIWVSQCENLDAVQGYGIAVTGDIVGVSGWYSTHSMTWGGPDTIGGFAPYQTFVCRLNANTGAGIFLDTIKTDGGYCLPGSSGNGSIASDPFGNFYAAGMFLSQIIMTGDTQANIGSYSNWWIAKLGTTNCEYPISLLSPEIQHPRSVTIFPNPSYGELTIKDAESGSVIQIYNLQGQIVYCGRILSISENISLANLRPGSYFLQITDMSGSRVNKTITRM